jgi:hypothetical protein
MGSPDTVHVWAADSADPIPVAVTVRRIARGARAELHVIEAPLPHMFMMFTSGPERVAERLASPDVATP